MVSTGRNSAQRQPHEQLPESCRGVQPRWHAERGREPAGDMLSPTYLETDDFQQIPRRFAKLSAGEHQDCSARRRLRCGGDRTEARRQARHQRGPRVREAAPVWAEAAAVHRTPSTVAARPVSYQGICGSDPIRIVSGAEYLTKMGDAERSALEDICSLASIPAVAPATLSHSLRIRR